MLGLKLNHFSKRGHRYTPRALFTNMELLLWWMWLFINSRIKVNQFKYKGNQIHSNDKLSPLHIGVYTQQNHETIIEKTAIRRKTMYNRWLIDFSLTMRTSYYQSVDVLLSIFCLICGKQRQIYRWITDSWEILIYLSVQNLPISMFNMY